MENKEIIAQGRTDATAPLIVGNTVFDPLTFAPEIVRFSRKQYIFLNAYKLGVPIDQAAAKAELTVEQAERFLKRPQTMDWLKDRSLMHHIKTEWEEPGKWWVMGNEVLEGKRQFNKAQIVVFQEFGHRAVPKKADMGHTTTKIEINIDPKAVHDAFVRQEAIDGELA